MGRFLAFLALAVWFALHKRPGGGGDGGNSRPKGGDGDGQSSRPSQSHGSIDASKGVGSAHTAIKEHADRGRPRGSGGSGNGNGSTGTTRPEGEGERTSSRPEWLDEQVEAGNEFNRRREPYYEEQGGANEVHVEPRTDKGQYRRVDSYVPDSEIVSRKHTQLADVQESTGVGYLREFANHYKTGTIIADTPTNRRDLGDEQIGKPLTGDMILEVPVQNGPVPRAILEEAERLNITIRDENGTVYALPDDE